MFHCIDQHYDIHTEHSFHLSPIPPGILTGTVTNVVGGAPIAGASVTVNAMTPVLTNAAGVYTVFNIQPGTVNVTAPRPGLFLIAGTAVITSGTHHDPEYRHGPESSDHRYWLPMLPPDCRSLAPRLPSIFPALRILRSL